MGVNLYDKSYVGVYNLTCLCKGNIYKIEANEDICYTLLNDRS